MDFGDRAITIKINGISIDESTPKITYSISPGFRNTIDLVKMKPIQFNSDRILLANIISDISELSLVNEVINLSYNIAETLPRTSTNLCDVLELIYNIIRNKYSLPIPMAETTESNYEDGEILKLIKDVNGIIIGSYFQ